MLRLCTLCARAGSKGVKNKNIRELAGKPLIAHSILQAKEAGIFDAIAVSSDSDEILQVSEKFGANYLIRRPSELATDTSPKLPVIRHCVQEVERLSGTQYDIFVDLDATSPLRFPDDIRGAVNLLFERDASNVLTGSPARRSPYFNLVELTQDGFVVLSKQLESSIVRRQDSPECYDLNASIYVWKRKALLNEKNLFLPSTALYVMPEERSVDIDSELDFEIVQMIMENRR